MPEPFILSIIDPRNVPDWNRYVEQHTYGWVSHRTEWFSLISHVSPGTLPRYAVVRRGNEGPIEAALPLCLFRSALGNRQLISLPYATLCDPLASNDEALKFLVAQLPALRSSEKASSLQLRTFQASDTVPPMPLSRNGLHVHHEIDLTKSEKDLLASFDGGCIRNRIKKALKGPLKVREGDTLADLENFYALYLGSRQRLGLPVQPWILFEALWRHIRPVGGMELLVVEHDNRPVGGLLMLLHGQRASAEVLAYDDASKVHCPNHLVFWTAICRAKSAGRTKFDFGRTPVSETDLVTFKDRWGTVSRPLPIFSLPAALKAQPEQPSRLYEITRVLLRRAPAPLYRGFSSLFYRWSC